MNRETSLKEAEFPVGRLQSLSSPIPSSSDLHLSLAWLNEMLCLALATLWSCLAPSVPNMGCLQWGADTPLL